VSLKDDLDAFGSEFMAKVPPEIRHAVTRADMKLASSGIAEDAIKVGDQAPDFRLPDAWEGYVRLRDPPGKRSCWPVLQPGNRAHCKGLCQRSRSLAQSLWRFPRRLRMRASQRPKRTNRHLSFLATAKAYGIAFDLAEELRPI
jgi:hypothetical protein